MAAWLQRRTLAMPGNQATGDRRSEPDPPTRPDRRHHSNAATVSTQGTTIPRTGTVYGQSANRLNGPKCGRFNQPNEGTTWLITNANS